MNRLVSMLFAAVLLLFCVPDSPSAAADVGAAVSGSLPLAPISVRFQQVPLYLAQSVEDNPRYGRIEAPINNDPEHPWYEVILTDRTMGERIFYLNSAGAVDILQHEGVAAHDASIEFTAIEKADANPIYQVAYYDSDGQQILWKLVANCQSTEQDVRFAPLLSAPGFVLMHASRRFAAAPGTTLTIGKKTEAMDSSGSGRAWSSISYRAFSAVDLVFAEIVPGTEFWTTDSKAPQIAKGTQWIFRSLGGHERKFEVEQAAQNQLQVREVENDNPFSPPAELDLLLQSETFRLRSVSFLLQSHTLRISFEPPVPLPSEQAEDKTNSAFMIAEDDQVIAKGNASVERALDCEHILWKFDTPDWARPNEFDSGVNLLTNFPK